MPGAVLRLRLRGAELGQNRHCAAVSRELARSELAAVDRIQLRASGTKVMLVTFLTEYLQAVGEKVNHLLEEDAGYYIVQRTKDYVRAHYTEPAFALQDGCR